MDPLSRAAGLAIVFGLLALFAWVVRRSPGRFRLPQWPRRGASEPQALCGDASLMLTPQHRLHLVRWQQRHFLVLTAPGGGAICQVESQASFPPAFAEALGSAPATPKEQA